MAPVTRLKSGQQLAEGQIASNETAAALVNAQFAFQAKVRDLDQRYQNEAAKLREDYLADVQSIVNGE
jgi:hypothetical protein